MAKQLDVSTRDHPSNRERLERIGLEWDTVEDKCVFESEQRLDFVSFKKWLCTPNNKIFLKNANIAMDTKSSVSLI
jgi:hypothetical protein